MDKHPAPRSIRPSGLAAAPTGYPSSTSRKEVHVNTLSATLSRFGQALRGGEYTGPGGHIPLLYLLPRQVPGGTAGPTRTD
mgnify:CR=1 FL=1